MSTNRKYQLSSKRHSKRGPSDEAASSSRKCMMMPCMQLSPDERLKKKVLKEIEQSNVPPPKIDLFDEKVIKQYEDYR